MSDRARIVGRSQSRMALSQVSAGWRTRGDLQRPGWANGTPGSVRGRSGDWSFYRDDSEGRFRGMSSLSYRSSKTVVTESQIHGRGLFAREPIAKRVFKNMSDEPGDAP
jgi:hypothetical protein